MVRALAAVALFLAAVALFLAAPALAQPGPPRVTSEAQCTVTLSQVSPPSDLGGWQVQFTVTPDATGVAADVGKPAAVPPYEASHVVATGSYSYGGAWRRGGEADVALPLERFVCGAATPLPPAPSPETPAPLPPAVPGPQAAQECVPEWTAWVPAMNDSGLWTACAKGEQTREEIRMQIARTCTPDRETRTAKRPCAP